jgi:site-specific DNA-methyltransferase (adenine-specific)
MTRKNKYIPHLAEFYFTPKEDWQIPDAGKLYEKSSNEFNDLIHYEDCIAGMDSIDTGSVDLIVADPPFGLDFNGKENLYNRNANLVMDGYQEINGLDYASFSKAWISRLPRLMKNTASAFIFSGWTNLLEVLLAIRESGLVVRNHVIWNYQFAVYTKRKFASSHYHVLYVVKDEKKAYFNQIKNYETDTWMIKREYKPGQEKNGTKLPTDLVAACINHATKPGDLVLDPFMGNGTTAVVAKGEFRHFVGFEINEKMKCIIDQAIGETIPGQFYRAYKDRLPTIEQLAHSYPHAYQEYLKKEGKQADVQ